MEVKIGVQHAQRELVLDTDSTPEDIEARLVEALAGNGVLRLADVKGRAVVVPADKIAYVELGSPTSSAPTPACPTRPPSCSRCRWWEWRRSRPGSGSRAAEASPRTTPQPSSPASRGAGSGATR